MTTPLKQLPAWQALEANAATLSSKHLRDLFAVEALRQGGDRQNPDDAGVAGAPL